MKYSCSELHHLFNALRLKQAPFVFCGVGTYQQGSVSDLNISSTGSSSGNGIQQLKNSNSYKNGMAIKLNI